MRFVAVLLLGIIYSSARAQDTATEKWNLHFQTTYIYQYKPAFNAAYSGPNSLQPDEEKQNSITLTLYAGVRLWRGAELYVDPEMAGGSGLSGAFGLAAAANGETFRVGDPAPELYLARAYLTQTLPLGSGTQLQSQASQQNALGGPQHNEYFKLYVGKFALTDIFDVNNYANSPRTQFLNWCLMNCGAWDYAANIRGYTYSVAAILQTKVIAYKAAISMMPEVANGAVLNTELNNAYAIDAEADYAYYLSNSKMKGNLRLLTFHNVANMGSYQQALTTFDSAGRPDVIATRKNGRTKNGVCLNVDQQLSSTLGVFARAGWNDGLNETWSYTETDRMLSAGINLTGGMIKRPEDNCGLAFNINGLSAEHRAYLAAGGLGFELGDGALNYGLEDALEFYYNCNIVKYISISGDYQLIVNPGYNIDRGPVNVFSFRLHVEI